MATQTQNDTILAVTMAEVALGPAITEFKERGLPRILAALDTAIVRKRGRGMEAVLQITRPDAEIVAEFLVGQGGRLEEAGKGMLGRLDRSKPVGELVTGGSTIATAGGVVIAEQRTITPAPKPASKRKARTVKAAPITAGVGAMEAAEQEAERKAEGYAVGYSEALAAFADNVGDPTTAESVREAAKLYEKLAGAKDASGYVKGMADGFADRVKNL